MEGSRSIIFNNNNLEYNGYERDLASLTISRRITRANYLKT